MRVSTQEQNNQRRLLITRDKVKSDQIQLNVIDSEEDQEQQPLPFENNSRLCYDSDKIIVEELDDEEMSSPN